MLRDPNGNIWSDAFLRHLYNDVQQSLQKETHVLEDVSAQRVPQLFHFSYQFDWEYGYVPSKWSQIYRCLTQHDYSVICHAWEAQAITGISSGVSDEGVHWTQPWEAFMGQTPGAEVEMRFPQNFSRVKFIAYDEEPIHRTSRKSIQSCDHSYLTRTGNPRSYYPLDDTENSYTLYPRPSTAFQNDLTGEGVAFYEAGDTESDETGIIAVRDDSTPSASFGASYDIVDTDNNIFIVYDVSPNDVADWDDEPDFQPFLRKYIRYGVISRAYGGNTDGRIPSLAEYWNLRYRLGIDFIKRYDSNRKRDRDYRLVTQGVSPRRHRRPPRLPDGYPSV